MWQCVAWQWLNQSIVCGDQTRNNNTKIVSQVRKQEIDCVLGTSVFAQTIEFWFYLNTLCKCYVPFILCEGHQNGISCVYWSYFWMIVILSKLHLVDCNHVCTSIFFLWKSKHFYLHFCSYFKMIAVHCTSISEEMIFFN